MGPQLERLPHDHSRARDIRDCQSPRSQVLFRPEEVESGSERVTGPPIVLRPLPHPDHEALGIVPRPRWID